MKATKPRINILIDLIWANQRTLDLGNVADHGCCLGKFPRRSLIRFPDVITVSSAFDAYFPL